MSSEFVSDCLKHKDMRHVQVRLDYMLLYRNETKAKIISIMESWTDTKRKSWYKEALDSKEQEKEPPEEELWVTMSYEQFSIFAYGTMKHDTIKRNVDALVAEKHMCRRIHPTIPYGPPQYSLNIALLQKLLNEQEIPSLYEGIEKIEPLRKKHTPHEKYPQGEGINQGRGMGKIPPGWGEKYPPSNNITKNHLESTTSLSSSTFVPEDAHENFPVAIDTKKDTSLQTEQGEDVCVSGIPMAIGNLSQGEDTHDVPVVTPLGTPAQEWQDDLGDSPSEILPDTDLEETVKLKVVRPNLESEHRANALSDYHDLGIPDHSGNSNGSASRDTTQAQRQDPIEQTTTPAESPPDGSLLSGIQQASPPIAVSPSTPEPPVGVSLTGVPASTETAQVGQYTTPEEWETAQKAFLEVLRTEWDSLSRQEKTKRGGRWDIYKKQQHDTWKFTHPKPKDEALDEACHEIYVKLTTEWRGYEWDTGGAIVNERTFIRNFVLKYRRDHPTIVLFFEEVLTHMTTKHFKWSQSSYRYKVAASDVYHETESILQVWKAEHNGHGKPAQNGKVLPYSNGNRNGQKPYVSVPEVFSYDRLKETPV